MLHHNPRENSLFRAIFDNDMETMIRALDDGADIEATVNPNIWGGDFGPLQFAAVHGRTEIVIELIARGASKDRRTTESNAYTAAVLAERNGHIVTRNAINLPIEIIHLVSGLIRERHEMRNTIAVLLAGGFPQQPITTNQAGNSNPAMHRS